ncbi:predicted protein [Histoplasma capsulatum G186AR]|uniref:Uncharacterized protein n=1 Tax=Ajellomyces capsulatus (strain G186AR / H82 / ATCC MYA-2454 / RMSCC 2432) TaxID=447093 RepID=C0NIK6_AJECG|nr:uncharacterized protein HCBG_02263 [Histoplasma capsulatum G186AR]EEH08726.1 predicted protein [Histoplasma capsulatum G186AR]
MPNGLDLKNSYDQNIIGAVHRHRSLLKRNQDCHPVSAPQDLLLLAPPNQMLQRGAVMLCQQHQEVDTRIIIAPGAKREKEAGQERGMFHESPDINASKTSMFGDKNNNIKPVILILNVHVPCH